MAVSKKAYLKAILRGKCADRIPQLRDWTPATGIRLLYVNPPRTGLEPEAYARDKYVGGVMGTNLHAVWDYYVLGESRIAMKPYADRLMGTPWPPAADTAKLDPRGWAVESCSLITAAGVYPVGHKMDHAYTTQWRQVAEQRVRLAGGRLADLLNQALD